MAEYRVRFAPAADRQLRKLPREMQKRVKSVIDDLAIDPRPPGALRLAGPSGAWRVRVGVYRIVYTIENDHLVVLVVRIGPRRDVYRGL